MERGLIIRLLVAIALGAVVGIEREFHSKSAGFRTMMMICLGACLFTILSIAIGAPGNPDRIASNVATGIGFIGAGVIFRGDNRVNGITTAATIWAVAAIGVAVGSGHLWLATAAAAIMLTVLALLPIAQHLIDLVNQEHYYTITTAVAGPFDMHQLLSRHSLRGRRVSTSRKAGHVTCLWKVQGPTGRHASLTAALIENEQIISFEN